MRNHIFPLQPGYAEQLPEYYWEKMKIATNALSSNHRELLENISALGITTFRDSAILLDDNYKPLRPMILWLDQRQAALKKSCHYLKQSPLQFQE